MPVHLLMKKTGVENGPAFLMQEETGWPEKEIGIKKEADIEVRKQYQEYSQERSFLSTMTEDRLDPTRYSSWTRLTRVSATVNRFLENCRLPSIFARKQLWGQRKLSLQK